MGERSAVLSVERGLYTLTYRHEAAIDARLVPPTGYVSPAEGCEDDVHVISAPGDEAGVLARPGSGLVVLAENDGALTLTVRSATEGGSLAADFDLKRVEASRPAVAVSGSRPRTDLPEGMTEFLVCAHVSIRGDVSVHRGDWICGPSAPGRIEGFELRSKGGELPLEYQVATAGRDRGWSQWFGVGAYAGTRGRALPLVGVRIRIREGFAPGAMLKAEAVFLGSTVVSRSGREIELIGPSPSDPLVGIRLDVARTEVVADKNVAEPAPKPSEPERPQSRLKVFRGARAKSANVSV